ncbi:MAG: 50S ribosomal protein L29 [Parcubacteria group bacterium]|nr:50S ribosomal protein L29 [Parcubacteria group bacterium]
MSSEDIKTQSEKDLGKAVLEKRSHLREARFNISGTKIKNVRDQRNTKRDIARILTELNMRSKQK